MYNFRQIRSTIAKISAVSLMIAFFILTFLNFYNKEKKPIVSAETINSHYQKELDNLFNSPENNATPFKRVANLVIKNNLCMLSGVTCSKEVAVHKTYDNSLIGIFSKLIIVPLTNPPASGIQDTTESFAKAGLIPKIYAAEGIGFGSISAFRKVWTIFRNIAYGFLVIIMVSLGIMIMFRFNLKAQTAISIENSLPRIIMALLLITFSYTIAGFMIDVMYLVMALIVSMIGQGIEGANIAELENSYLTAGPTALLGNFFKPLDFLNVSASLILILPGILQSFVALLAGAGTFALGAYIIAAVNDVGILDVVTNIQAFTFSLGGLPKPIIGIIVFALATALGSFLVLPLLMFIFMSLTAFYLFVRIFFMLLLTYLRILILVLFSPLFMLFQAVPGRNAFSYWIRSLFGELMTFPIIAAVFLTGDLILTNYRGAQVGTALGGSKMWEPPYLYGLNQDAFILIVGLGIVYLVPDIVKVVKDMLGVKTMPVSMGIGTFFGGAGIAMAGGGGLLGRGYKLAHMINPQEGVKSLNAFIGGQLGGLRAPFRRTTGTPQQQQQMQQRMQTFGGNTPSATPTPQAQPGAGPLNSRIANRGGNRGSGGQGTGGTP